MLTPTSPKIIIMVREISLTFTLDKWLKVMLVIMLTPLIMALGYLCISWSLAGLVNRNIRVVAPLVLKTSLMIIWNEPLVPIWVKLLIVMEIPERLLVIMEVILTSLPVSPITKIILPPLPILTSSLTFTLTFTLSLIISG